MSYSELIKHFLPIDLDSMRPKGFLTTMTELGFAEHSKVDKKHGWKPVSCCPVCSSSKAAPELEKFGVKILRCDNCTLCYSSKIPVDTADIYADNEYVPETLEIMQASLEYRKKRFGVERIELIKRFMAGQKPGKILDIGCGTGWVLEVARESGFEIHGQEMGKFFADWTAKRLGCPIYSCPVSEIPGAGTFNVITMFDLIEHIPEPVPFTEQCAKLLAPGGIILMLTPNFDSLAVSVMREHSSLVIPAEHVTYFTKQSITHLLNRCGLQLEYYCTSGIDIGDLRSFYEWQNKNQLAEACSALYNVLQPAIDGAEAGNHLRVIARKD